MFDAPDLAESFESLREFLESSDRPYIVPTPQDNGWWILQQPLAECLYALRDVVELVPEKLGLQPTEGQVVQKVIDDIALTYGQYPRAMLEKAILMGYFNVRREFTEIAEVLEDAREVERQEVKRIDLGNGKQRIEYEVKYEFEIAQSLRLNKEVMEVMRPLYYAVRLLSPAPEDPWNMFLDVWSRLSAVPKSGTAGSRSALLALTSHFEGYLQATVRGAIQFNVFPELKERADKDLKSIETRAAFSWYRNWLMEALGEDRLGDAHEIFERRNMFIHHSGLATGRYVEQFPHLGAKRMYPIPLTREYLLTSIDTLGGLATDLTNTLIARGPTHFARESDKKISED